MAASTPDYSFRVIRTGDDSAPSAMVCYGQGFNLENMKPIGMAESLFEAARTYRGIRDAADVIVPPFDPELSRPHPDGVIA